MAKKHIKPPQRWLVSEFRAITYIVRRNGTRVRIVASPEDIPVLSQYRWHICGKGYAWTTWARDDGKAVSMHSMVLGKMCDHINNNPIDNRLENLRLCSHQQNQMNKLSCARSVVPFKGVSMASGGIKYVAKICANGKHYYLGRYTNARDAALSYDDAARRLHGEFACTNESLGLI